MIDDKTINHISSLSRLNMNRAEKEKLKKDMEDIINYIGILNEIEVTETEPLPYIFSTSNVFREDVQKESQPVKAVVANAEERTENYFKVPRTIEAGNGK